MINLEYIRFIKIVLIKIKELGVDVSKMEMDHVGYQASSDEDYNQLTLEFNKIGKRLSEVIVGGRRVGIYKLNNPIRYMQYLIPEIELIAPKKDQVCPSALEHAEFVLKESFESFMKKYSNLPWDTSAISQLGFPLIKLRLDKDIQVKFHL